MTRPQMTPAQKKANRRGMLIAGASALLVLPTFYLMRQVLPPGPPPLADQIALGAGATLITMGIMIALAHVFMSKSAPAESGQRLAQVVSSLTGGASLLMPVFGANVLDPQVNFAILIVLTLISLWAVWVIWRGSDELARKTMLESYALTYLITSTGLWLYGAGERLGLVSGASFWLALGLVTVVGLICSVAITVVRGLDQPMED